MLAAVVVQGSTLVMQGSKEAQDAAALLVQGSTLVMQGSKEAQDAAAVRRGDTCDAM